MTRSVWKGPFVSGCFFREKYAKNTMPKTLLENPSLKIYARNSVILPRFVGKKVQIHNGKTFVSVLINEQMVGHKFGEFAFSKKKPIHKTRAPVKAKK